MKSQHRRSSNEEEKRVHDLTWEDDDWYPKHNLGPIEIKDGKIVIEISDETPVHQTNASFAEIGNANQIKKMIDQIQSLQKNVVRMEREKNLMKLELIISWTQLPLTLKKHTLVNL